MDTTNPVVTEESAYETQAQKGARKQSGTRGRADCGRSIEERGKKGKQTSKQERRRQSVKRVRRERSDATFVLQGLSEMCLLQNFQAA